MKTTASNSVIQGIGALFVSAALALSGCALPDKPVHAQAYDLGVPTAEPTTGGGVPLALDRIEAPAALDSTALVYRLVYAGGEQQPRHYANARWSMPPPQLLVQRLRHALAARHAVLDGDSPMATLKLRVELDEFDQVFGAPETSEGVVRLRVTASTSGGIARQRLLGQRDFMARQPAPTPDAAGGALALRTASDEVLRQVVDWVGGLPTAR